MGCHAAIELRRVAILFFMAWREMLFKPFKFRTPDGLALVSADYLK